MLRHPLDHKIILKVPGFKELHLLKWIDERGQKQSFSLAQRESVCKKWLDFGILLGISMATLKTWERETAGDTTACWRMVMEYWIHSGVAEDYPVTWQGLITLLEDVKCLSEAEELGKIVLPPGNVVPPTRGATGSGNVVPPTRGATASGNVVPPTSGAGNVVAASSKGESLCRYCIIFC